MVVTLLALFLFGFIKGRFTVIDPEGVSYYGDFVEEGGNLFSNISHHVSAYSVTKASETKAADEVQKIKDMPLITEEEIDDLDEEMRKLHAAVHASDPQPPCGTTGLTTVATSPKPEERKKVDLKALTDAERVLEASSFFDECGGFLNADALRGA